MSAAVITREWADGTYAFRLTIPLLEEHDEKCGAGPMTVLSRLLDGSWRLPDVRETIRLALIGGGLPPVEAHKLVRRYVDDRPLTESVPVAIVALSVALRGASPGKSKAATSASDPAPTGSTLPPSAATPPP